MPDVRFRTSLARSRAFTVVELLIVIVIIAILAAVTMVVFSGSQKRTSGALVQQTISDARKSLQVYYTSTGNYSSNIADTTYEPPLSVAVVLYTNAPQQPTYSGLTNDQNAQLFLNSCNASMPIVSGGTTYNTSCSYAGNNAHIAGQVSSNVVIKGPSIAQSDFVLTCGSACTTAQNNIINSFLAQGGTFPITVPKKGATLPAPTMQTAGAATNYCIEGRSPQYDDVIYHMSPESGVPEPGPCPSNPSLHYP